MQIDRNRIIDKNQDFILKKVNNFSVFQSFSCGDTDLNDFIRNDAEKHRNELLAETYVLMLQRADVPIAFCSLCNDAIQFSKDQKSFLPEKKRYPYQPAVKIARLGVDENYQKKNIGTYIIGLIKHFFIVDNRTGCRFITVDAYNEDRVLAFYRKNDFQFLNQKDTKKPTRTMYFDLKRLIT